MDDRLLEWFNRELKHVRERAQEFGKDYPKVARQLGIYENGIDDPYIHYMLEAFAYMTARIQLKREAAYPEFTQQLVHILFPQFIAQLPAMTLLQLVPAADEGTLNDGFELPRDSLVDNEQHSVIVDRVFRFSTTQAVTLWPLTMESAGLLRSRAVIENEGWRLPTTATVKTGVKLTLSLDAGLTLGDISLDQLDFYVNGAGQTVAALYESLLCHCQGVCVRGLDADGETVSPGVFLDSDHLSPLGFDREEAALPVDERTFSGQRLLLEYFAYSQKFRYLRVNGLRQGLQPASANKLELLFLLDTAHADMRDIDRDNFLLFVVPAINLFEKKHESIRVEQGRHRFPVRADDTDPHLYEVHSIKTVRAVDRDLTQRYQVEPLYGNHGHYDSDRPHAFYTLHRTESKVRLPEYAERFDASKVTLSMVDVNSSPYTPDLLELDLDILVSNVGDLKALNPDGYRLTTNAPVAAVRAVVPPSDPIPAWPQSKTNWLALDHLTFNFQALDHEDKRENARYLQKLLALYAQHTEGEKLLSGLRALEIETVTRQFFQQGHAVVGNGVSLTLEVDEYCFEGTGCFLLGAILERYFAQMVSMNSFVETHLKSSQRGEVASWNVSNGSRALI
ncbi:Uncharacterised protein [BD1-7 clade bacterium]|uniref:Type VI secretion system protein ImpG n=1 Tax=BD1-7 clade bacterium TaxID=2029982 RepID=A0A5S9NWQ9_9GAMM|nr:Uncharacterised protein [BD1-7 clade bacterium]CAA0095751.1 Uncharacterised protein [BD1-7 clade bacterium]